MSLKILQLISSAGFFGAENVLLELSSALMALGHAVTIGIFDNRHTPHLEVADRARERSLVVELFPCRGRIDVRTAGLIRSFVNEKAIDIVHSHGYKSNSYALASNIHSGVPLVSTCHNWINSSARMSWYTVIDKMVLRHFNSIVAVSSSVRDQLLKSGLPDSKVMSIENGVSVEQYRRKSDTVEVRKTLGLGLQTRVIGTVGRLSREKGHIHLLRAARTVLHSGMDCAFLIIGDGPLRAELQQQAESLGIAPHVHFAGMRYDIPRMLPSMDLFVLPSLVEGQPMALLEAMAAEVPVIATRVGDISKIIRNGESGLLVPAADENALSDGIRHYLRNPVEAKQAASSAFKEVVEHHSSAAMGEKYLALYHSLMSGRVNRHG
jgi:glycosyltransferase involved in cell wall biosynthesis